MYVIKAWAIDEAGRRSKEYSETTVGKDTVAPTDERLEVKAVMSKTIVVEAGAKDNGGSGIYQYIFKYKLSGTGTYEIGELGEITVSNDETCRYSFKGLETNASYDILVEIRDKAGNKKTVTVDTYVTKEWVAKVRRLCRIYTRQWNIYPKRYRTNDRRKV